MKVAELIEALRAYPADALVVVHGMHTEGYLYVALPDGTESEYLIDGG